jgi:hypothetical protein
METLIGDGKVLLDDLFVVFMIWSSIYYLLFRSFRVYQTC